VGEPHGFSRVEDVSTSNQPAVRGLQSELLGLGAWGVGRLLGVGRYLKETEIVTQTPALQFLLG